MLGQVVEDPTAASATLEWSSILLRSFLMDAGLSMDAPPYMNYYLDTASAALDSSSSSSSAAATAAAAAAYGSHHHHHHAASSVKSLLDPDDDNDDMHRLVMQQHHAGVYAAQTAAVAHYQLQFHHHQQQQQQLLIKHNHKHSTVVAAAATFPNAMNPLIVSADHCSVLHQPPPPPPPPPHQQQHMGGPVSALVHLSPQAPAPLDLLPTTAPANFGGSSNSCSNSSSSCSTVTTATNSNNAACGGGGGLSAVVASSASPWMDPRLWGRLPEKLVERVLACLPLPSFFRSRLVCKRWYDLLFSDSFLEVCAKVRRRSPAPRTPWFLLFRRGVWTEAFAFDTAGKAWFRLDLSFLPPRFNVVASAGGLICLISEERGCKTVLICNPIARTLYQLPNALKERFVPTVGLVVVEEEGGGGGGGGYRVLAAGDDLISPFAVKNLTTEVYDSALRQWRMTAPLPRLCNLESGKTTYANGFFYCMNYSPFSVLSYDTARGTWSKIQAPMRRFLRTPNLVECRGRLLLVAAVEKNKLNVPKSIRIWGLQQSRSSWVELERMPQALYEDFMRVSAHNSFHCTGHANLILITLPDSPDMLLYDLYDKLWRWAPRCPFAASASDGFHAFSFDPRLEASVC